MDVPTSADLTRFQTLIVELERAGGVDEDSAGSDAIRDLMETPWFLMSAADRLAFDRWIADRFSGPKPEDDK